MESEESVSVLAVLDNSKEYISMVDSSLDDKLNDGRGDIRDCSSSSTFRVKLPETIIIGIQE
jgi:hypothetical protein